MAVSLSVRNLGCIQQRGQSCLFLDIVEQDLKSADPQILSLLKPASSGIFGGGCF
jgi:hypothetical protein